MSIKGYMGIEGEDDDESYKTKGGKSLWYGANNNINSKLKI